MGIVPISARVAIQLASLHYRAHQWLDRTPAECARIVMRDLPLHVDGILRFALHSLSIYLNLGWTARQWLTAVLEASHYGSSFRRCFFFDYKENRRPYPRVTNRGVQDLPKRRANRKPLGETID